MTEPDSNSEAEAEGAKAAGWMEFALAVMMALAAVGTAWAGFQSSKWSGVQANSYAQASSSRTESNRAFTEAGQERIIDIVTFGTWLTAVNDEIMADPSADLSEVLRPGEATVDGFVFIRFREDFTPAMDAWLATDPFTSPDAPTTPFAMPEYRLQAEEDGHALLRKADGLAAKARTANQRSDNYVLTAVIFALVLFFAALAGRARTRRPRWLLFYLAAVALVTALVILLILPVTV